MQQKKILVIQPLPGIGDLFWFDADLQSLSRFYQVPLTLMTKRQSQAQHIYKDSPYVKDILWLDRPGAHSGIRGLMRSALLLRKHKFSDVWIFHKSWRYKVVCKLAGIQNIIAYPSEKKWLDRHPIDRVHQLLKDHHIPLLKDPKFLVGEEAKKTVAKKLKAYKKPWVAIGIGGMEPSKKWEAENWEDLAVWLSNSKKMTVFFLGGAREQEEAPQMVQHVQQKGGKAQALTTLSLHESLAFLDQVAFFVGNDTGMMNGAVVQNKQTFSLFLSSLPLRYRPNLNAICPEREAPTILLSQVQEALETFFNK
jgi:heptosyltransferase II